MSELGRIVADRMIAAGSLPDPERVTPSLLDAMEHGRGYGRSPGMDALPTVRAINQEKREEGLPKDREGRKHTPMASGLLDYFPDALAAVAHCSYVGNEQHNPGEPLHWARDKSDDHADCVLRHMVDRGTVDTDGVRHSAKVAWRALAMLQLEIEAAQREQDDAD